MKKICLMAMFLLLICSICTASFSPSKMKIGDVDGEWTYIGRYGIPEGTGVTIKDFVLFAQPFQTENMNAESLYDVYFYHVHGKEFYNREDGVGCRWYIDKKAGEKWKEAYNCVLKMVPLDKTGKPILKSGLNGATIILSIAGHPRGPQYIFYMGIKRSRGYDAISHQLLWDMNDSLNDKINSVSQKTLNCGHLHNLLNEYGAKVFGDNMYRRASRMSNCPDD